MKCKSYQTTKFRNNMAQAFNDVQSDGLILIQGQGRPEMVLTLKIEHETLNKKISQLVKLVKSTHSDSLMIQQELAYYKSEFNKLNDLRILKLPVNEAHEIALNENRSIDLKGKF